MLQHPTIAERVLADWRHRHRTTSLSELAERHGAERRTSGQSTIEFASDDDTILDASRGVGAAIESNPGGHACSQA